ncbi:hypothetical protein MJA45_25645 [Paenibacillus aurantius]|uniref:Uncharacterized protein n=1 Tax=Paenibacillus aurantius TaxID=2918900 RepID=A0AA96RCV9_9BACL|nr:hypothetical protein [Paenibacillus aurantius]WNQ10960.1 hypothetical protein MJA45_25645 [Paenibacillus aurantius]
MSEQMIGWVKGGLGLVSASVSLALLGLWVRRHRSAYGWLAAHLLFVTWALIGVLEVAEARRNPFAPTWGQGMEQAVRMSLALDRSLKLIWSGLFLTAGMVCLVVGLVLLRKTSRSCRSRRRAGGTPSSPI